MPSNAVRQPSFDGIQCILFDAVGTLIRPDPPVAEIYTKTAAKFGSDLSIESVSARFCQAVAEQDRLDEQRNQFRTSETRERDRWRWIVSRVFHETSRASEVFDALWEHFSSASSWTINNAITDAWPTLQKSGLRLGVASNFDERLRGICRDTPALAVCDNVFVSSIVGWRKPALEFFRTIEGQLKLAAHEILLVGDDPRNDVEAAKRAGWQAISPAEFQKNWNDRLTGKNGRQH